MHGHDIVKDPLPAHSFDLIHARLVLAHLPARDQVLPRLVASLRPGGWLVVEDFDSWLPPCLDPVSDDQRACRDTDARRTARGSVICVVPD